MYRLLTTSVIAPAYADEPTGRYRRLLARTYGILGQLTLCGSRLRRDWTGRPGSA
ncbi:hypothetical protein ACFUIT_26720 [Streptomyces sp. NPDC057239]|uniref:hypothetical protein n=1 Tax=Streptomyces sp. NPDC057239 TaxID=3346061 RepID=UPI0036424DDC